MPSTSISSDDKRVNPTSIQVQYLDEIASRLGDLQEFFDESIPVGQTKNYTPTITTTLYTIDLLRDLHRRALSVTIRNDGPGILNYAVNNRVLESQLKSGEFNIINMMHPKIEFITLQSTTSCSIRLEVLY